MARTPMCVRCGAELPPNSAIDLCPSCLVQTDRAESEYQHKSSHDAPTVALETPIEAATFPDNRIHYFGDYELLEEIGRGGMGVVYKAEQASLSRIVALKLILSGRLASEADVQRFYAEAQAAARLQHPNLVAIYEVGQHEGQHYFSMDYVEGTSLANVVKNGPLPAKVAAQLIITTALAVEHAHSRGVIHRDLKPSNILIDTLGEPRVTDFGLAKRIDVQTDLTRSGQLLGTPSYMPPERISDQHVESMPESDVYSLGAILYELLTGNPPFQAESALETLLLVVETEPIEPRRISRKIPRELERICLKALNKDPHERYRSAQCLADDLERFLLGEPTCALQEVKGRTVRWVGGCALAFLLLIGSLTWAGVKLFTAGVIWFEETMTEFQSEQNEFLQLAASWNAPSESSGLDALFPKNIYGFTLKNHSDKAFIEELHIDVPGLHALYESQSARINFYVYRVTELECEALLRRIHDLWEEDSENERKRSRRPNFRYGPVRDQRDNVVIVRYGFAFTHPPASTALLWNANWLLLARANQESQPEIFLKMYLQSMAGRNAEEKSNLSIAQTDRETEVQRDRLFLFRAGADRGERRRAGLD